MRRTVIALLTAAICFLISSQAHGQQQGTPAVLQCTFNGSLDVHASAQPSSPIVARVKCGERLLLIEERFGSPYVRTTDGTNGFILGLNIGQWSIEPEKAIKPVPSSADSSRHTQGHLAGTGPVFQVGFSHPDITNAFGFAAGWSARISRIIGFASFDVSTYPSLIYAYSLPSTSSGSGAIVGFSSSRYRWETFKNGQTRCRDLTNGQFAPSALCGAFNATPGTLTVTGTTGREAITAGMFDANVLLPGAPFLAGVGYRTGSQQGKYGSLGLSKGFRSNHNAWFIRGLAGRDFWQVNIGIAAYWPR